jgi:hypothetical protein
VELVIAHDHNEKGDTMTSMMRRAVGLLCLTGAFVVTGLTAGPGLAQGPSPAQLAEHGWTCVVPPVPGIGMACFNPGLGRPPIPSLGEDGRPFYINMLWTPAGDFLGHAHLIRPDLYAGQPCPHTGGLYVLNPRLGYYECLQTV